MTWFCIDVEADGPAPIYSMLSLGAVALREGLKDQLYVELAPLEGARCIPEALAVSGLSMDELEATGLPPKTAMQRLADWVPDTTTNNAVLVSDSPGFEVSFAHLGSRGPIVG